MKSKIVALSKNEEFKSLLRKKKVSNKYLKQVLIGFLLELSHTVRNRSIQLYYLDNSACAAANLATGTLNGEQET